MKTIYKVFVDFEDGHVGFIFENFVDMKVFVRELIWKQKEYRITKIKEASL